MKYYYLENRAFWLFSTFLFVLAGFWAMGKSLVHIILGTYIKLSGEIFTFSFALFFVVISLLITHSRIMKIGVSKNYLNVRFIFKTYEIAWADLINIYRPETKSNGWFITTEKLPWYTGFDGFLGIYRFQRGLLISTSFENIDKLISTITKRANIKPL